MLVIPFARRDLRRIVLGLILLEACFVAIHVTNEALGPWLPITYLFDLDGEQSIPAWFAASQLLVTGFVMLGLARTVRLQRIARPSARFLGMVGLVFVFASVDEAAGIHEGVSKFLRHVDWLPRFAGDHGVWIPIYVVIGIVIAALTARDVASVFVNHRGAALTVATGAALFLTGAVALEIFAYEVLRIGERGLAYELEVALEEWLEMVGSTVMLLGGMRAAFAPSSGGATESTPA